MFALTFSDDFLDQEKVKSFHNRLKNEEPIEVSTSGSTRIPKTIVHPFEKIRNSAKMTNAYFGLSENTNSLLCMSIDTIAGKMILARAFEGRYSIQIQAPSSRPLENCETKIDFIAMVPVQLAETMKYDREKLKTIPSILVGGGPISEELEQELQEENLTVYHSFGMTETVSHIAMRKVGANSTKLYEALPGVSFQEKEGKLILSAEHLKIENLETNDLVELTSPTRFRWLGRADWVVNSGGYKIQLEEMERLYSPFLTVPFFFWKEPDEKWGEALVLCIQIDSNVPQRLPVLDIPAWKVPKKIYHFSDFVYSKSNKILRKRTFDQNPVLKNE